jgi:DNA-binding MarR family transcriptional regulator
MSFIYLWKKPYSRWLIKMAAIEIIIKVNFMENSEIVLETLRENGPLRPGEVAEKTGLAKVDVEKVISKLKKEEKIFSPKRCFYDVKD